MTDLRLRHDWQLDEVEGIYHTPLFELVDRARAVHCETYPGGEVQLCSLVSVKTGDCPEDCSYCSQSAHHSTHVPRQPMLDVEQVLEAAQRAKAAGSSRLCMSAAWSHVADGPQFDQVLAMVRGVKALGLEACCTLGMLSDEQAGRLKDAGIDAYNHNIDTSREFTHPVVSTRRNDARLQTLRRVRKSGITICSGGIIGMGESARDRCAMLVELASFDPHPEAVPINALVPIPGTPLESLEPVAPIELVRMIATARIMLPHSKVRLSAGRSELPREAQLFCLYAGANSIFIGDQLLTSPNPDVSEDRRLLEDAGLVPTPLA
jgi:biotin synthase